MIFEPFYLRFLKGLAIVTVVMGAWLWMTTDEYQLELEEISAEEQRRQRVEQRAEIPEPEPELPVYKDPEPQYGWIVPPKPVQKKVAKVKRKVKRAVQK